MVISTKEREEASEEMADLARAMKELAMSDAGAEHKSTIIGFAAQAAGFAGKIKKASNKEAGAIIVQAHNKRDKWMPLIELLAVAAEMSDPDSEALKVAEEKIRATATQLRKVAEGGSTEVFKKIGGIATQAEEGLKAFLAAPTPQEKWNEYGKVEEARERWAVEMTKVHEERLAVPDDVPEGETAKKSDKTCNYLDDPSVLGALKKASECVSIPFEKESCTAAPASASGLQPMTFDDVPGFMKSSYNAKPADFSISASDYNATAAAAATAAPSNSVPLPPLASPEEIRQALLTFIADIMILVKASVATATADDRFGGCHDDSESMLAEAEKATVVFIQDFGRDADGKAVAFRNAIQAAAACKKACFNLQKYDIYQVTGSMPKLAKMHKDLAESCKAVVDIMDFCKTEASEQEMKTEVVAKFLRENWATFASETTVASGAAASAPASVKEAASAEDEGILV